MDVQELLKSVELNEVRYLDLLTKLIGESKHLQNSPAQGLIPQENLAIKHILDVLAKISFLGKGFLQQPPVLCRRSKRSDV